MHRELSGGGRMLAHTTWDSGTLLWYRLCHVDPQAGFSDCACRRRIRSGTCRLERWQRARPARAQEVQALLQTPLTADGARRWRSSVPGTPGPVADLGVAQADLVQAGLLEIRCLRLSPCSSPRPGDPGTDAALEFLDLFPPLRTRVATARLTRSNSGPRRRARLCRQRSRRLFTAPGNEKYRVAPDGGPSARSHLRGGTALHAAGTLRTSIWHESVLMEEAKVQLRTAEVAVRQSREALNTLMGLWGPQTAGR